MSIRTTALHNSKKEILKFNGMNLQKMGVTEFAEFMDFVNMYDTPGSDDMTTGQWKKLYACLSEINKRLQSNYMIYENPHGVMFDVSTHTLGTKEDLLEAKEPAPAKESSVDKLKRYIKEVEDLDQRIEYMQKRREEFKAKIAELKSDFMSVMESMEKLGI